MSTVAQDLLTDEQTEWLCRESHKPYQKRSEACYIHIRNLFTQAFPDCSSRQYEVAVRRIAEMVGV